MVILSTRFERVLCFFLASRASNNAFESISRAFREPQAVWLRGPQPPSRAFRELQCKTSGSRENLRHRGRWGFSILSSKSCRILWKTRSDGSEENLVTWLFCGKLEVTVAMVCYFMRLVTRQIQSIAVKFGQMQSVFLEGIVI